MAGKAPAGHPGLTLWEDPPHPAPHYPRERAASGGIQIRRDGAPIPWVFNSSRSPDPHPSSLQGVEPAFTKPQELMLIEHLLCARFFSFQGEPFDIGLVYLFVKEDTKGHKGQIALPRLRHQEVGEFGSPPRDNPTM